MSCIKCGSHRNHDWPLCFGRVSWPYLGVPHCVHRPAADDEAADDATMLVKLLMEGRSIVADDEHHASLGFSLAVLQAQLQLMQDFLAASGSFFCRAVLSCGGFALPMA